METTLSPSSPVYNKIAFIGFGLIASSMARAVRKAGLARTLSGAVKSEATLNRVRDLGLAEQVTLSPAEAVADADLVVIATPLSAYETVGQTMLSGLKPGATITDVGSVKHNAIESLAPWIPEGVHFIPGHPIAGTENSGPDAGFAELFEGRWCILTPLPESDPLAIARLEQLWRGMGAMVTHMAPDHHDKVLAITSHLPHLIAYTIVGTATDLENDLKQEVIAYSASGFRDFTRIAASDPVMWRDIFLNNREAVLEMLQRFTEDLTALQKAIRRGQGDVLEEYFTQTRTIRRKIIDAKQA